MTTESGTYLYNPFVAELFDEAVENVDIYPSVTVEDASKRSIDEGCIIKTIARIFACALFFCGSFAHSQVLEQKTPTVPIGNLGAIPNDTILGNNSGSPAAPSALTVMPTSITSLATNGTVQRTFGDRATDILNVKDFGAKCDEVYKNDGATTVNVATLSTRRRRFIRTEIFN